MVNLDPWVLNAFQIGILGLYWTNLSYFVHFIYYLLKPAKIYKLKHLSKVEVNSNDPSGCTFTLVLPTLSFNLGEIYYCIF